MLKTPFGEINFYIDGVQTNYVEISKLPLNESCFLGLDGRFSAVINYIPDGKIHRITCKIENYFSSENDGIESGENLMSFGFYKNDGKLSIGIEYDCCNKDYDYGCAYSKDGYIEFIINESTKTAKYVFGIAWIEHGTIEGYTNTWFGADPTLY